jgi:hypothetical protein
MIIKNFLKLIFADIYHLILYCSDSNLLNTFFFFFSMLLCLALILWVAGELDELLQCVARNGGGGDDGGVRVNGRCGVEHKDPIERTGPSLYKMGI